MTFSRLSSPLRCCLHYDFVERAATARRGGYYTNVSACDSTQGVRLPSLCATSCIFIYQQHLKGLITPILFH
jgi:hypothetical protein